MGAEDSSPNTAPRQAFREQVFGYLYPIIGVLLFIWLLAGVFVAAIVVTNLWSAQIEPSWFPKFVHLIAAVAGGTTMSNDVPVALIQAMVTAVGSLFLALFARRCADANRTEVLLVTALILVGALTLAAMLLLPASNAAQHEILGGADLVRDVSALLSRNITLISVLIGASLGLRFQRDK